MPPSLRPSIVTVTWDSPTSTVPRRHPPTPLCRDYVRPRPRPRCRTPPPRSPASPAPACARAGNGSNPPATHPVPCGEFPPAPLRARGRPAPAAAGCARARARRPPAGRARPAASRGARPPRRDRVSSRLRAPLSPRRTPARDGPSPSCSSRRNSTGRFFQPDDALSLPSSSSSVAARVSAAAAATTVASRRANAATRAPRGLPGGRGHFQRGAEILARVCSGTVRDVGLAAGAPEIGARPGRTWTATDSSRIAVRRGGEPPRRSSAVLAGPGGCRSGARPGRGRRAP